LLQQHTSPLSDQTLPLCSILRHCLCAVPSSMAAADGKSAVTPADEPAAAAAAPPTAVSSAADDKKSAARSDAGSAAGNGVSDSGEAGEAVEVEVQSARSRFLGARGRARVLKPLPVFDELALYEVFRQNGVKNAHATTVWKGILKGGAAKFDDIKELPKKVIALLNEHFVISTSVVKQAVTSSNEKGSTTKLVVQLQDGLMIESVIIRH
jgi:hypothetical protein